MKVNKIIYSVLAFFLGGLGVHKFFVNKTGLGIIYLLFCWTGIPGVIGIIEGILAILKPADKEGNIIIN
ncbi:TM2 domain-containing protein [Staphylococcus hominis]|uniref:TM2 domain-containing protein n=1 Tax=Staphylococcus hominis TaxID=1290 RepID=UPI001F55CD5B|nr:TM2 domain-containing protein [Staphylococcus hominis]MCI2848421.1 TM2 domain-containing protein [Staphylococcus hominis]MCI2850624.1 TM2 domain-containing protein [Staphylococcus hominis]MCI2857179.1 TM2 domain-containing protein [Staphylococcus hominis]